MPAKITPARSRGDELVEARDVGATSRADDKLEGESWFRAGHESQVGTCQERAKRPASIELGACPQMTPMGRR
jgi:hypothetical protein